MSVQSTARYAGPFAGNAVTTVFAFAFKVFATTDVVVLQTVIATGAVSNPINGTDYTVALNADQTANPGGTITFAVAPPATVSFYITSGIPKAQASFFPNPGPWNPTTAENAWDKSMALIQEIDQAALKYAPGDVASTHVLPSPAARANTMLGFDAVGALKTLALATATTLTNLAASAGASLIGFIAAGVNAVIRTIQDKLRDAVSIKDFGAVGNGVADDTAARDAWLAAAAGRSAYAPSGTYLVSTPGVYDTAASGPIEIFGEGAGTIFKTIGALNAAFEIHGVAGSTQANLVLRDLQIVGANSGTATNAILLEGIAVYSIHDVRITGNGKFTNGIRFTGAQQGEWSGGYVNGVVNAAKFDVSADEGFGLIPSNACDLHGVSMAATTSNVVVTGAASIFIHDNHFEIAPTCIDAISCTGLKVISNHIENGNAFGVRTDANCPDALIAFNTFVSLASAKDLQCAGSGSVVAGNKFAGNVELVAGASNIKYFANTMGAGSATVLTDNATNTEKWGNKSSGSGDPQRGANFNDSVTFASRATAAGKIGTFKPNAGVGGAWGIGIEGAGAGASEIYVELGAAGPVVESLVSADQVLVKSAIGGTTWTKATGTDFSTKSKIYPGTDGAALQTASGIYAGTGVPSNANGANGDFYFRSDGGAGTCIYQRRAGAWVATGA